MPSHQSGTGCRYPEPTRTPGSSRWPAALILLAAWLPLAGGATTVSVEVLDTDPPDGTTLYRNDALYVRLGYQSDVPMRIRIEAVAHGNPIHDVKSNPAPAYPAGTGEAIAWIEPNHAGYMNELRVRVTDEAWQPLAEYSVPMTLFWERDTRPAPRTTAAWVTELNGAQQAMVRSAYSAPREDTGLGPLDLVLMLMAWSIPGYFILQIYMLRRYQGGWRKAALAPLFGMVPLLAYTLLALLAGSNIWPLMLLFLTPLAFIYLAGLGIVHRVRGPATADSGQST